MLNRHSPSVSGAAGISFAVALGVRLIVSYGFLGEMPMVSDAESYAGEATAWQASFPPERSLFWPPGNPLVLALASQLLGPDVAFRLTPVVLSALTAPLIVFFAAEIGASRRTSFVAGLLWAVYPPAILLAGQSYAQHLSALCLVSFALAGAATLRTGRAAWALAAGAALGLGALTRPAMLSLIAALLVGLVIALRRRRQDTAGPGARQLFFSTILAISATAALLLPIMLHNYQHGAGLTLSTNNERNLFLGNNPHTPDYKTSHLGQRSLEELPPEVRSYLQYFYDLPDSRRAMQAEAVKYMVENPARTLKRTLSRLRAFWGFDYLGSRIIQAHFGLSNKALYPLLLFEAGAYSLIVFLFLAGLFLPASMCCCEGPTQPSLAWVLVLIVAFQAPYLIAFSAGTYHFPVLPLLLPWSARALLALSQGDQAARYLLRRPMFLFALAVFVAIQLEYGLRTLDGGI